MPNVGDVTKVDWRKYKGKCDVVVGGSPCQSFSVAGKREGLQGESGLMYEYIRAVREIRPAWFLWENVPGALSSEGGEVFRQLLSEMDELGYGMAWRVLDAQFFGVAQRRRRVFLVGHLGACHPAEVLFEPESLRGDYPSSREKREALAAAARRSPESFQHVICIADDNAKAAIDEDMCGSLKVGGAPPWIASGGTVVRRLTPRECERLQGFPDGWTRIPWRGRPADECPDGPRYKAIGNSMAVPVMRWIGERIDFAEKLETEVSAE